MGLLYSKQALRPQGVETASGKYCKLILTARSGSGIGDLLRQLAEQDYCVGTAVSTDVHRCDTARVVSDNAFLNLGPELMFRQDQMSTKYGFTRDNFEKSRCHGT